MSEPTEKEDTFGYYFSFLNKNLIITEMFEEARDEVKFNTSATSHKEEETGGETCAQKNKRSDELYFVEEPFDQFDYIFEPEHYANKKKTASATKTTSAESVDAEIRGENKFTHARLVRDTDGLLEYEYQSYTYVNRTMDTVNEEKKDKSHKNEDTGDLEHFLNDFDFNTHHHLNAIIRGTKLIFVGLFLLK